MALSPGTALGPYAVTAKIGEGGMGEVYQARDTTLDRDVALKVLPEAFTADPDRLARFEREAKVLASLNHPNIGTIYGLEEAEGGKFRALVLELVEGPTLADRITQGPIPIDEALPIAKQIAEALEAAHEQGVIHRDLKPANIKVKSDGTVKVLDFGLAKAFQPDAGDPGLSQSPTISLTAAATQMGMVIGTAAYMSPEQARGKTVDKRTDIWAFGVVLYEMLSGARPFQGEDVSLTLASVMKSDVNVQTLPREVPQAVRTVLDRCLEKNPNRRIRDIGDVTLAMEGAFEATVSRPSETAESPTLRLWQRPTPLVLAGLALLGLGGLAVWSVTRPAVIPSGLVRFSMVSPETASLDFVDNLRDLVISPDGTQVIYNRSSPDDSGPQLNLRPLDQLVGAPLRGGEGGMGPFVSPNGQWVGFRPFNNPAILQMVSIFGGPPVTLTEAPRPVIGASWGADDQIIFGTAAGGLFRVSGGGGEPKVLTTLDPEHGENSHTWPFIIPGREAVVFVIGTGPPLTTGQLAVLELETGEITPLGLAGVSPHYVSTGHLVYAAEDGSVRAVPFDATTLEVTGNPVPLLQDIVVKVSGAANFSISDDGRLVYASGESVAFAQRTLAWVDREGREETISAQPRTYVYPRVSPDGMRVALDIRDWQNDIWVWQVPAGPLRRLTLNAADDQYGHWTPDGDHLVFSSSRDGASNLYRKAADGTGAVERLTESASIHQSVNAITRDGTRVIARAIHPERGDDLIVVTLDGDRARETLLGTEFNERNAAISPDGQWMAYQSDASGSYEIYVRPFPDVEAGLSLVSTEGGQFPVWASDGSELFFVQGDQLMAALVQTDASFTNETPKVVFEAGSYYFGRPGRSFDVAPDGRFLMVKAGYQTGEDASAPEITVVLNWFEELTARVPVP